MFTQVKKAAVEEMEVKQEPDVVEEPTSGKKKKKVCPLSQCYQLFPCMIEIVVVQKTLLN